MKANLVLLTTLAICRVGTACELKLPGNDFLRAAAGKGNSVTDDPRCAKVVLSENVFYAPPDKTCTVSLRIGKWLKKPYRLIDLRGGGHFTAIRNDSEIKVTISIAQGFRVLEVILSSDGGDCSKIRSEDVISSPLAAAPETHPELKKPDGPAPSGSLNPSG